MTAKAAEAQTLTVIEKQCQEALDQITIDGKALVVNDPASYEQAINMKARIKKYYKFLEGAYGEIKTDAYSLWKKICKKESDLRDPAQTMEKTLDKMISGYLAEQRRKADEEAARLQAEAIEEAEKKRKALLAKADKAKSEEKKELLQEQAEAVYVEPIIPQQEIAKMVSTGEATATRRKKLSVEITDQEMFLKAIAALITNGQMSTEVIQHRPSAFEAWVKSTGNMTVSGARITWTEIVAVK